MISHDDDDDKAIVHDDDEHVMHTMIPWLIHACIISVSCSTQRSLEVDGDVVMAAMTISNHAQLHTL